MKPLQVLLRFALPACAAAVAAVPQRERWSSSGLGLSQTGSKEQAGQHLHAAAHVSKRLEEETTRYAVYGGVGLFVIAAVGGLANALSGQGGGQKPAVDGGVAAGEEGTAGVAAGEESTAGKTAESQGGVDCERLLKLMAKRAAQQVGPKLAKAHSVRGVLEGRVWALKNRAANFVFDECMGTLGTVLREMGAEEVMLLLNPSASSASNIPPASILLAGLMSPFVLMISLIIHLSQVFLVLLPTLGMCAWAVYVDRNTLSSCAVPTIWYWVFAQGAMALVLAVAHMATMVSIQSGRRSIQAKMGGMQDRLREAVSDGELSVDEIRELFIIVSVLLEHSLVVEDHLRRSVWRSIIGYGTILWMGMTFWTFVVVLGWTFVPGVVAFHAAAAGVAGGDFCGAWATVLAARLSCVLSLLFIVFNMISVVQFVSDKLVVSESYSATVLASARALDESMLGMPVVQTLVKAFLLRGTAETIKSQIAQSRDKGLVLEGEKSSLQTQIEVLSRRITVHKTEAKELKKACGIADVEGAEATLEQSLTQAGTDAVEQAAAQARALEEATKKEIDQLYQKIVEAANQLRESSVQALAEAQEAAAAGAEAAQHAAKEAAESGRAQAEQLAEQASKQMKI